MPAQPNPLVDYLVLVEKLGPRDGGRAFFQQIWDARFDRRVDLAIFVAAYLGHEFPVQPEPDPNAPEPATTPDLDETCLVCHRKLFVPVDRPGVEGSAIEEECSKTAGSNAKN